MWCRKRSRNWGVRSGRMETTPRTTMNQSSVSLLLLFPPTEEEKRKPRLFLILFRGTYYKGAPLFYKEHHMCRQKDHFWGGGGTKGAEKKKVSRLLFSAPMAHLPTNLSPNLGKWQEERNQEKNLFSSQNDSPRASCEKAAAGDEPSFWRRRRRRDRL